MLSKRWDTYNNLVQATPEGPHVEFDIVATIFYVGFRGHVLGGADHGVNSFIVTGDFVADSEVC